MTPDVAKRAKTMIHPRLAAWTKSYLAIPGFADWKNEKLKEQLLLNLVPGYEISDFEEFKLPDEIIAQQALVAGYYNIVSTQITLRQTEQYFRRYPFRKNEVSREDHLKTCCELLFSRLYHFRERFFKHLTLLNRKTEPKNSLDIQALRTSFEAHFKPFLDQRRIINHETGYSDVELGSIGLSDLLSDTSPDFTPLRASSHRYKAVVASWVDKTRSLADELDLYVGYAAIQMMMRCSFLSATMDQVGDEADA